MFPSLMKSDHSSSTSSDLIYNLSNEKLHSEMTYILVIAVISIMIALISLGILSYQMLLSKNIKNTRESYQSIELSSHSNHNHVMSL